MPTSPEFDVAAAHKYFAADCFNKAWDLIDKTHRTPEEERLMVALSQASIFHWLNRPDCSDKNLSVGYWQASRIQAILGNPAEARRYAEVCLGYSGALQAFHLGYAYEALARAAVLAGEKARAGEFIAKAEEQASLVTDSGDRELLMKDLADCRRGV